MNTVLNTLPNRKTKKRRFKLSTTNPVGQNKIPVLLDGKKIYSKAAQIKIDINKL